MKTDLSKILSISGQHGLYRYLAQARGGAIVESLSDGKRTVAGANNRITTLADISIYKEVLGDAAAPSPKADAEELKSLFKKALPDYDGDRFYVSHMKKVVEWYNELREKASLDFVEEEEDGETEATEAAE